MLYYYEGKTRLMLGAEKLPVVESAKEVLSDKEFQNLLNYTFFCYNETPVNPYVNILPAERKAYVINANTDLQEQIIGKRISDNLQELINDYEAIPVVGNFIDEYLKISLSTYERQRRIYLMKIENYMNILSDPNSSPDQEKEADQMIELFNKRLVELEAKIQEEKEAKTDGSSAVLHLFELPSSVSKFFSEHGISIN